MKTPIKTNMATLQHANHHQTNYVNNANPRHSRHLLHQRNTTMTTTTSTPIPSGVTTLIALLLLAASSSTPSAAAALTLTVEPFAHQAIEVGQDAQFVCTRSDKGAAEAIVWTFSKTDLVIATSITTPNQNTTQQQQQSQQSSLIQRATNVNGTLKIQNATESDKGRYVCSVVVPADPDPGSTGKSEVKAKASVQLVVYTMPDYTEELVGIAMVCLGLLVALILLSLHKSFRHKKRYPPPQSGGGAGSSTAASMQASFDNSGVLASDEITIVTVVDTREKKQCEF